MFINRILAVTSALVMALLVIGANVGQFTTLDLALRGQAREDALGWVQHLASHVPELSGLVESRIPNGTQLLALADELDDRYGAFVQVFDHTGTIAFSAGGNAGLWTANWNDRIAELVRTTIATQDSQADVLTAKNGDQPELFAGVGIAPVFSKSGELVGVLVAFVDRTVMAFEFNAAFTRLSIILSILFSLALIVLSTAFLLIRGQARSSRQQAEYLAHYDQLTGLYNRAGFRNRLADMQKHGHFSRRVTAIIYIDIDNFKTVNDSEGHGAGDAVLRHVGHAIQDCLGPHDAGVRFGGDEFVVICQCGTIEKTIALVERMRGRISRPVANGETELQVNASFGIYYGLTNSDTAEGAVHRADLALYQAKLEGRNTYRVFTPELEAKLNRRLKVEGAVRRGLANKLFSLDFQPLVESGSRRCLGFEALLRLTDYDGERISPAEFIPVAESTGLVRAIGEWVLFRATEIATQWPEDIYVSVNLSARQFDREDLVDTVADALKASGLAPSRLELEVTESLLIENSESVWRQLAELQKLGVSIAMDDFGTGYSSLGYLWKYRFDKLKIDRSFIIGLDADKHKTREIVDAIIALAHRINMKVTAEGIETDIQAASMAELGCDQFQGYFFGKPMGVDDLAAYLLANMAEISQQDHGRISRHRAVMG